MQMFKSICAIVFLYFWNTVLMFSIYRWVILYWWDLLGTLTIHHLPTNKWHIPVLCSPGGAGNFLDVSHVTPLPANNGPLGNYVIKCPRHWHCLLLLYMINTTCHGTVNMVSTLDMVMYPEFNDLLILRHQRPSVSAEIIFKQFSHLCAIIVLVHQYLLY